MNVSLARNTLSTPERWLWRLVTAGLLGLAAGLMVVGFTLYA